INLHIFNPFGIPNIKYEAKPVGPERERNHDPSITALDFVSNGRHLLAGARDGVARKWDLQEIYRRLFFKEENKLSEGLKPSSKSVHATGGRLLFSSNSPSDPLQKWNPSSQSIEPMSIGGDRIPNGIKSLIGPSDGSSVFVIDKDNHAILLLPLSGNDFHSTLLSKTHFSRVMTQALHPVIILFAILAGVELGGFIGLVFAIPVIAVIKTVFSIILHDRRERIFSEKQHVYS
ncbi:hypothetical protein BVX98_03100, partial [bacterium F11]